MFDYDEDELYEAGYEDGYEAGRLSKSHQRSNNSGNCYIATCIYGSYDCPEVWTLRRFRDQYLKKFAAGRLFIKGYYALSPKLVSNFGDTWFCRQPVKWTLSTIVNVLNKCGYLNDPYEDS